MGFSIVSSNFGGGLELAIEVKVLECEIGCILGMLFLTKYSFALICSSSPYSAIVYY